MSTIPTTLEALEIEKKIKQSTCYHGIYVYYSCFEVHICLGPVEKKVYQKLKN